MTEAAHISDQPYPIRRLFYRRVVPALVLSAMVLLGGGWVAVNSLERHVYLETTQRRVETTVDLAEQAEPQVWMRLLSGKARPAFSPIRPAHGRRPCWRRWPRTATPCN